MQLWLWPTEAAEATQGAEGNLCFGRMQKEGLRSQAITQVPERRWECLVLIRDAGEAVCHSA